MGSAKKFVFSPVPTTVFTTRRHRQEGGETDVPR